MLIGAIAFSEPRQYVSLEIVSSRSVAAQQDPLTSCTPLLKASKLLWTNQLTQLSCLVINLFENTNSEPNFKQLNFAKWLTSLSSSFPRKFCSSFFYQISSCEVLQLSLEFRVRCEPAVTYHVSALQSGRKIINYALASTLQETRQADGIPHVET